MYTLQTYYLHMCAQYATGIIYTDTHSTLHSHFKKKLNKKYNFRFKFVSFLRLILIFLYFLKQSVQSLDYSSSLLDKMSVN